MQYPGYCVMASHLWNSAWWWYLQLTKVRKQCYAWRCCLTLRLLATRSHRHLQNVLTWRGRWGTGSDRYWSLPMTCQDRLRLTAFLSILFPGEAHERLSNTGVLHLLVDLISANNTRYCGKESASWGHFLYRTLPKMAAVRSNFAGRQQKHSYCLLNFNK